VPVETNPRHADAAQLEVAIRAFRDGGDAAALGRQAERQKIIAHGRKRGVLDIGLKSYRRQFAM
jgi:hypothetical protein